MKTKERKPLKEREERKASKPQNPKTTNDIKYQLLYQLKPLSNYETKYFKTIKSLINYIETKNLKYINVTTYYYHRQ